MGGNLFVISGPMFSGKTSYLIDQSAKIPDTNKILINHILDSRYSTEKICSHDHTYVDCVSLSNLNEIKQLDNYKNTEYIFIDEGQFFKDIKNIILEMVNIDRKTIYISGLLTDYKQEAIGELGDIICYADKVEILHGKCAKCINPSLFTTKRILNDTSPVVVDVGHNNKYDSLCRNCIYN